MSIYFKCGREGLFRPLFCINSGGLDAKLSSTIFSNVDEMWTRRGRETENNPMVIKRQKKSSHILYGNSIFYTIFCNFISS